MKHHLWTEYNQNGFEFVGLDDVVEAIENADEAVIRCEDCGRYALNLMPDNDTLQEWCCYFGFGTEPDDFCSKAKPRKKVEHEQ